MLQLDYLFKKKKENYLHFAPNVLHLRDVIKVEPVLTHQAFDWLSVSGVFNRGYNERRRVFPVLGETGAEDWVQTLTKGIGEGVEMQTRLHVIERNMASFIIQEDSHFTGLRRQH